jgi:hypothetical protein
VQWVEGANLRHTSEVLCFLYWVMVHTPCMVEQVCSSPHRASAPGATNLGYSNRWLLLLRSMFDTQIQGARACAQVCMAAAAAMAAPGYGHVISPQCLTTPVASTLLSGGQHQHATHRMACEARAHLTTEIPWDVLAGLATGMAADATDPDAAAGLPLHLSARAGWMRARRPRSKSLAGLRVSARLRPAHCSSMHGFEDEGDAPRIGGDQSPRSMTIQGAAASCRPTDGLVDLLVDMSVHGDGGWVLDRLVAPLFLVLAHEVSMHALLPRSCQIQRPY